MMKEETSLSEAKGQGSDATPPSAGKRDPEKLGAASCCVMGAGGQSSSPAASLCGNFTASQQCHVCAQPGGPKVGAMKDGVLTKMCQGRQDKCATAPWLPGEPHTTAACTECPLHRLVDRDTGPLLPGSQDAIPDVRLQYVTQCCEGHF